MGEAPTQQGWKLEGTLGLYTSSFWKLRNNAMKVITIVHYLNNGTTIIVSKVSIGVDMCCQVISNLRLPDKVFKIYEMFREWFAIDIPHWISMGEFHRHLRHLNLGLPSLSPALYPLCWFSEMHIAQQCFSYLIYIRMEVCFSFLIYISMEVVCPLPTVPEMRLSPIKCFKIFWLLCLVWGFLGISSQREILIFF